MPAVTADTLTLPRLAAVAAPSRPRPVAAVVPAVTTTEGEGFQVRRAFPGIQHHLTDPFLLLDHLGAVEYEPGEAKGAPDHPHRGFETVTYVVDGAVEHRDSTGGGGIIRDGATQWMTAGAGIVHSELPPEWLVAKGGLFHGAQLWVNLPRAEKLVAPRYQDIAPDAVRLLSSPDGGALVRLIAGDLGGHSGPGRTRTPITYAHVTLSPGALLEVPWHRDFNALAYAIAGRGSVGAEQAPLAEGHLAILAPGDHVTVRAGAAPLDVLLLGGRPIREPVVFYGPFVMNHKAEILEAIDDYRAGRMGRIPPVTAGA